MHSFPCELIFFVCFKLYIFLEIILGWQKSLKNNTEYLSILQSTSPNINVLYNHNSLIWKRKLTLV